MKQNQNQKKHMVAFRLKKEKELIQLCDRNIENSNNCLNKFTGIEDKIFFKKMGADHLRYIHEHVNKKEKNYDLLGKIEQIYQETFKLAKDNSFDELNYTYLQLKLNYCVFVYSQGKAKEDDAIRLCQDEVNKLEESFKPATVTVTQLYQSKASAPISFRAGAEEYKTNDKSDETKKDLKLTLNLFKENLALWQLQKRDEQEQILDEAEENIINEYGGSSERKQVSEDYRGGNLDTI